VVIRVVLVLWFSFVFSVDALIFHRGGAVGAPPFFSWGVWLMLQLLLGAIVLGVKCLVMGVFSVHVLFL